MEIPVHGYHLQVMNMKEVKPSIAFLISIPWSERWKSINGCIKKTNVNTLKMSQIEIKDSIQSVKNFLPCWSKNRKIMMNSSKVRLFRSWLIGLSINHPRFIGACLHFLWLDFVFLSVSHCFYGMMKRHKPMMKSAGLWQPRSVFTCCASSLKYSSLWLNSMNSNDKDGNTSMKAKIGLMVPRFCCTCCIFGQSHKIITYLLHLTQQMKIPMPQLSYLVRSLPLCWLQPQLSNPSSTLKSIQSSISWSKWSFQCSLNCSLSWSSSSWSSLFSHSLFISWMLMLALTTTRN